MAPATTGIARVSTPHQRIVDEAARNVGARLRSLRKARRLTLIGLAKLSDVDAATISRVETGRMTGTLESHLKLATALGIKVTDLYVGIEEARTKGGVSLLPASGRKDVYVHRAGKFSTTLLTTDVLSKKLMPVLLTLEPGGTTNREEAKVGTERFLYVLEGMIEARIGEAVHTLKRGSSLYFDASIPHVLKNPSQRTARCLSVVTPPVL